MLKSFLQLFRILCLKKGDSSQMFWIILAIVLALLVLGAIIFFFFSTWNPLTSFVQSFAKTASTDVGNL